MAKKKEVKYTKLYFMKAPKGYGYHAGHIYDVPGKMAEELVDMGVARPPKQTLPKDFPRREDLIEAGLETVQSIKNADDLTKVKGIGKAGEKEIAQYLKDNS